MPLKPQALIREPLNTKVERSDDPAFPIFAREEAAGKGVGEA